MHLRRSSAGALLANLAPAGDWTTDSDAIPLGNPLIGSWAAVRWQYTSRREPRRTVDVVTDLAGSVTLSLTEGTYVLTWGVGGQGGQSIGGTFARAEGGWLELTPLGASGVERVAFRLTSDTLALSSDASDWDFDGSGEEPADFVAVLVRL